MNLLVTVVARMNGFRLKKIHILPGTDLQSFELSMVRIILVRVVRAEISVHELFIFKILLIAIDWTF